MGERLAVEDRGPVRLLTLDNPSKRNALDFRALDELEAACLAASRDGVRCLLLRGAGDVAFSSGFDLAELGLVNGRGERPDEAVERAADALAAVPCPTVAFLNGPAYGGGFELAATCDLRVAREGISLGLPPAKLGVVYPEGGLRRFLQLVGGARTRELFFSGRPIDAHVAHAWGLVNRLVNGRGERPDEAVERAADALAAVPCPTVAFLNGPAYGGGFELAATCDLRVAREGISLGLPPAKLGVVYPEGGLRRFLQLVGGARTRELFFLGRPVDAHTAHAWGLVNRLVPAEGAEGAALALAEEIARNAPLAVQGMKRILQLLEASHERGLSPAERDEIATLRRRAFESQDIQEGRRAFAERRPPRFQGR